MHNTKQFILILLVFFLHFSLTRRVAYVGQHSFPFCGILIIFPAHLKFDQSEAPFIAVMRLIYLSKDEIWLLKRTWDVESTVSTEARFFDIRGDSPLIHGWTRLLLQQQLSQFRHRGRVAHHASDNFERKCSLL